MMRKHGFGITGILGAFISGAAAMYFADAQSGGRRRALVRDKAIRAQNIAIDTLEYVEKDFENRTRGMLTRLGNIVDTSPVSDDVLIERVRSKLGHACSHPSAIEVHAKGNGVIELKGPVLAREKIPMLAALALVPGVRMIDDDLEVHPHADVPALQGHARRAGFIQRHWNPTTRALTAASGAVFLLRAALNEGLMSGVHFAVGSSLIGASLVDFPSFNRRREMIAERMHQEEQQRPSNQASFR